jgi:hypothetical protein
LEHQKPNLAKAALDFVLHEVGFGQLKVLSDLPYKDKM